MLKQQQIIATMQSAQLRTLILTAFCFDLLLLSSSELISSCTRTIRFWFLTDFCSSRRRESLFKAACRSSSFACCNGINESTLSINSFIYKGIYTTYQGYLEVWLLRRDSSLCGVLSKKSMVKQLIQTGQPCLACLLGENAFQQRLCL